MVAGDRITGSCSSRCRFPHLLTSSPEHRSGNADPAVRRAALPTLRTASPHGAGDGKAGPPRPPGWWRRGPTSDRWTGLVLGRLARRLPGGGDQSVELGPHQLVVIEHEVEEVVLDL